MKRPVRIDVTIFWTKDCDSMSYYSIYTSEIEEMVINYEKGNQALLFSYVKVETIRQWLWDVFCREPEEVVVDEIKY